MLKVVSLAEDSNLVLDWVLSGGRSQAETSACWGGRQVGTSHPREGQGSPGTKPPGYGADMVGTNTRNT